MARQEVGTTAVAAVDTAALASRSPFPSTTRMILHIDMDAFYASVEQRDNPALQGKPVVVGGPAAGRGVVSAASYEAREFGIHSAMPTATAARLCPHAIFLPGRMQAYASVSQQIREIFLRYTPLVEPLSLDEAFLDVQGSERLFGSAIEIGRRIQHDIANEVHLVASVGVAPNKFLAKLASDLEKPNGFVIVPVEEIQEFLDPLPISRLWGVGRMTAKGFDRFGVRTIAQLRRQPLTWVQATFGDQGTQLWNLAHGKDDRAVVPDRQAKSISNETTFAVDIADQEILRAWLLELAGQVGRRLRRAALQGRTVQLKVRFPDFRTITRVLTLPNATDTTQEIYAAAVSLFNERLPVNAPTVRLLGVGISGLAAPKVRQKMLFEEQEHETQSNADQAADEIRERFGHAALSRGSRLLSGMQRRGLGSNGNASKEGEN